MDGEGDLRGPLSAREALSPMRPSRIWSAAALAVAVPWKLNPPCEGALRAGVLSRMRS